MPMSPSSSSSSSYLFTITYFLILVSLTPLSLISSEQGEQVQIWVAPLPFQSCVGAIANSRPMGTGM